MNSQNTIYIAEPIYSELLQKYDSEISFPPIKKIGITTDHPERREKELLGTISPIKVSIVKAWTGVDAREVESMLHTLLDNSRLDGEYFWDGNETLVDGVVAFIEKYYPEAEEITINDSPDVKAASASVDKKNVLRIYEEVVPMLEEIGLDYNVTKNEKGVRIKAGEYNLHIGARTGGRYTLTIWSKKKSTEDALKDFSGSQELSARGAEDSYRRARMPMAKLEDIRDALKSFVEAT